MSLHQILETLINHTTGFKTENERHQLLDLLDAHVDRAEPPSETSQARTDWKTPVPTTPSGIPIPAGASLEDLQALMEQNRQLIAMLQAGRALDLPGVPASPGPTITAADVPAGVAEPAPLPPPVSPADVPPGVT